MILFKIAALLHEYLEKEKNTGKTVGFIPTMGALHQGHLSLLQTSLTANDITVASIFVNPTQFNNPSDYEKYPSSIEKDIALLEKAGCDILFWPGTSEIYPQGMQQLTQYDIGLLETVLEGKYRPGHFQGVCNVMHALLNIVSPHHLYMGSKDYQQCLVVQRLLTITNSRSILHPCPTLREADGLAMSSRNQRLSIDERKKASAIYKALTHIKNNFRTTSFNQLQQEARELLLDNGFGPIDYIVIAHANDLTVANDVSNTLPLIALLAATINSVRLIDNLMLD
jgi:pantoate--beta-alanine ligase